MAKTRRSRKVVATKGHTRSPRGANKGKPRPRVKPYKRKRPDPSSYPRR